jgi:hypothetical protein
MICIIHIRLPCSHRRYFSIYPTMAPKFLPKHKMHDRFQQPRSTAFFTLASATNQFPSRCFLGGEKSLKLVLRISVCITLSYKITCLTITKTDCLYVPTKQGRRGLMQLEVSPCSRSYKTRGICRKQQKSTNTV